MSRTGAFGGDARVKEDLLARIDRHVAAGTLTFGDTGWDGKTGSPLGVSIEGTDPDAYVAAYGYPLPLAALLDGVTQHPWDGFDRAAFVRQWVAVVNPGADLAPVPTRLMLWMLDDPRLRGIHDPLAKRLAELHSREMNGLPAPRSEWATIRRAILAIEPDAADDRLRSVVRMWEAAAWPAARGRSTLTGALTAWSHLLAVRDDTLWSAEDERRKDATLQALWDENTDARDAGEHVNYPALFTVRDRDLAERFSANLARDNARFAAAPSRLAGQCVLFLEAA